MAETSSPTFKRWHKAVLALGFLAGLGALAFWFLTTAAFWQQVGWRLVSALQDRVNGRVSVDKITGDLVTGMVFENVAISRPQGDIIRVKELEVSLSLLSLFKLQPVIRLLAFRQPELFLHQDAAGAWNVADLLKKRPPPPFTHLHLTGISLTGGSVHLDRPRQQLAFQDIQVQLNLTVQSPGRPNVQVLVHQGSLGVTSPPYPRLQADLALTYAAAALQLQKTDVSLDGLPVLSLQGEIVQRPDGPEAAITLQTPALSGSQVHHLWSRWPRDLPVQAALELKGPLADLQLTGRGSLKDCQIKASGSWRQTPPDAPKFHLALDFQNLTGALLAAWQPQPGLLENLTPVSGAVSVHVNGLSWPPADLQARLDLKPFSCRQARVEAAALTLKTDGDQRQHLALKLQGNFGRLETEAAGQLLPLKGSQSLLAGDLQIAAGALNPSVLLGGQAPPGSLDLKFTGDFRLPPAFNWPQARLAGKLQASGKLKEFPFQELAVQGSWEAGVLQLNPARLLMPNLRAEAQGRLASANTDLKLSLDLLPPGPWPLLPPDFKGQFRAEGTVKGPWQALAYQMGFQGKTLSWRRFALESVQGKTAGTASREVFTITGFDLLAQKLSTPVGRFGQIQGQGRLQGGNLVFDLKAQDSPGQGGSLAGSAAWEKNAVQLKMTQFHWGPPNFRLAAVEPATVTMGPGRFEISPLRLRYQKTFLALAGKVVSDHADLQLNLDNLLLDDIARLAPQISLLHGTINAQANLSGSGRNPVIKGQIQVAPGQIGKFQFDSFQTNWLYQGNTLSLDGRWLERPDKAKLAWQGSVPLTLSLLPWTLNLPESGLNVRAWSENLNLSLFSSLIRGVSASEGPMQLQAQVSGSLRRPLLAGSLRYGPGVLTIRESGAPLAIEAGEIRLEGDRLLAPRLVFRSGDGQGEITGGARLENFTLRDVDLNLVANDLLIIKREGSRAVARGQVSLKGSWPDFQANGRLTVDDGVFRLSFFRSEHNKEIVLLPRVCPPPAASASPKGAAAVERNFTVNLTIDIPGGVWLRDKDLQGELEGQIKVLRQPPGPKYLGGWVRAKGGVFAINNKIFTVEKAALTFPGKPDKPIQVDARAYRKIDEYTLFLAASGPLDNPRTRLESNPPLPPRDQLSLLVFDHLADKMTREEYVTATQKAMGILGSLTARKLKSLLGEELPILGEVSPTTSQEALGVGKKLSKDITVSYERKLNPLQGEDVNQIRLDYKFHKYFSAESQLGRKNTGGDLFFSIDF